MQMQAKVYTKTGDKGTTQLADGTRVSKASLRITAGGCIDELSAFLGLALVYVKECTDDKALPEWFVRIRQELMLLNARLALAPQSKTITIHNIQKLEQEIDALNSTLPPLTSFTLLGGNKVAAYLHVTRTVCRRAERAVVQLAASNPVDEFIMPYLNRLSDWLFVVARFMEEQNAKK